MSVTIKQIAEICGVSREDVYRILSDHAKSNTSPKKIIAVKRVARDMGYVGAGLSATAAAPTTSRRVGVVINSEGNRFFDDVISGLHLAHEDLKDFGVQMSLRTMRGYRPEAQLQLIDAVSKDCDILILSPINHERIKRKIDELSGRGIPVITLNTDIEDSQRVCYIGSDYRHGGRIAGNLAGMLYRDATQLGIIAGARNILGHRQRAEGFMEVVRAHYGHIQIVHLAYDDDDERKAMQETERLLAMHPGVKALFVVAAGVLGVCRAITALGREKDISVIGFDSVPTTIEYMKAGIVRAVLFQQPITQGYKALKTAYYCLVGGEIPESQIVNTSIKIMANVFDEERNDIL